MTSFDGPTLGARIGEYRRMNGWSQSELAHRTKGRIKAPVIANIESGRKVDISVDQLIVFAEALQVSPSALLFDIRTPAAPSGIEMIDESGSLHKYDVTDALRWMAGPVGLQDEDGLAPKSRIFTEEVLSLYADLDDAFARHWRNIGELSQLSMSDDPITVRLTEVFTGEMEAATATMASVHQRLKQLGVNVDKEYGRPPRG